MGGFASGNDDEPSGMPSLLEHFRGEEIIADHFDTIKQSLSKGSVLLYVQWRQPREMGGTGVFSGAQSGQVDLFCFQRVRNVLEAATE